MFVAGGGVYEYSIRLLWRRAQNSCCRQAGFVAADTGVALSAACASRSNPCSGRGKSPFLRADAGRLSRGLQAAGLAHTAGTLFALPLVDFPAGLVRVGLRWQLPGGRHADDHHLHPADPPVRARSTPCARMQGLRQWSVFVAGLLGVPKLLPEAARRASVAHSHGRHQVHVPAGCPGACICM